MIHTSSITWDPLNTPGSIPPFARDADPDAANNLAPSYSDWLNGVLPNKTVPAKWQNYIFNFLASQPPNIQLDIEYIITELLVLLSDAGLTPDDNNDSQLVESLKRILVTAASIHLKNLEIGQVLKTISFDDDDILGLTAEGQFSITLTGGYRIYTSADDEFNPYIATSIHIADNNTDTIILQRMSATTNIIVGESASLSGGLFWSQDTRTITAGTTGLEIINLSTYWPEDFNTRLGDITCNGNRQDLIGQYSFTVNPTVQGRNELPLIPSSTRPATQKQAELAYAVTGGAVYFTNSPLFRVPSLPVDKIYGRSVDNLIEIPIYVGDYVLSVDEYTEGNFLSSERGDGYISVVSAVLKDNNGNIVNIYFDLNSQFLYGACAHKTVALAYPNTPNLGYVSLASTLSGYISSRCVLCSTQSANYDLCCVEFDINAELVNPLVLAPFSAAEQATTYIDVAYVDLNAYKDAAIYDCTGGNLHLTLNCQPYTISDAFPVSAGSTAVTVMPVLRNETARLFPNTSAGGLLDNFVPIYVRASYVSQNLKGAQSLPAETNIKLSGKIYVMSNAYMTETRPPNPGDTGIPQVSNFRWTESSHGSYGMITWHIVPANLYVEWNSLATNPSVERLYLELWGSWEEFTSLWPNRYRLDTRYTYFSGFIPKTTTKYTFANWIARTNGTVHGSITPYYKARHSDPILIHKEYSWIRNA